MGENNMADIKRSGGNSRRSLSAEYGGLLYTAGITTTNLEGDITEQTQDVLGVIDNILARHGIDKTRVISASITLVDMENDYADFNGVWDLWVTDAYEPVRSVTGGALAIPEYKVKISVVAAL